MVFYKTDYQAVWASPDWDVEEGEYGIVTGSPGSIPITDEISNEYLSCEECAVGYRCAYPMGNAFDLGTGLKVDLWEIIERDSI